MKFERFIAARYLRSKHKMNFITVISIISIVGITIGVAALIVVLSIFNGFNKIVTNILVNFDPHVKIESYSMLGFDNYSKLENEIKNHNLVNSYSPFVKGKVVIYSNRIYRVVSLQGIQANAEKEFNGLKQAIRFGKYQLDKEDNIPSVLIGMGLAFRVQASLGDTITIISPVGLENLITTYASPKMSRFVIRGIFDSNNKDYDAFVVFTSLEDAQNILGMRNKINGFEIRANKISQSNELKDYFNKLVDHKIMDVKTWFDLHKQLYSVMLIERWTAYIILSLIIAVAAFNIFGSLTMTVISKKRDIGLLKALGASEKSIKKIFLIEGILIGLIGTVLGLILGLIVCYIQIEYKIYPLDPTVYIINALPVDIRFSDIIAIGLMSMFLSIIAGYLPARKASKVFPLDAIKWE